MKKKLDDGTYIVQFELGRVVATPGALSALQELQMNPLDLIARHASGDWGDCCPDDWKANDFALDKDLRIVSVYWFKPHGFYCITEADRSSTCLLLCSEY